MTEIQKHLQDRTKIAYISWSLSRFDGGRILKHLDIPLAVLERHIITMTEAEEKFAKYFKVAYDKAIDISQMSYEQLDMWIDELEDIILTAKASVQGASLGQRERKAKLSASEKEKTRSGDSTINVSDAMSAVRKRTERMSKLDKLKAMYDDMVDKGTMSREDANSMLGLVKVDESKQSTMSFNKDKNEAIDTAKLAQDVIDASSKKSEAKPETIDFDSLFGPKKDEK